VPRALPVDVRLWRAVFLVAFFAGVACGSPDPGAIRSFRLAASGSQLVVTGPSTGLLLTQADLATDVDVVAIHQEFYGVPWEAFAAGGQPPPGWAGTMSGLASAARSAGKQVFLSVSPLDGNRSSLAPRVRVIGGTEVVESDWAPRCWDFRTAADGPTWRDAYVRYVEWMVDLFQPEFLNVGIELNLWDVACPSAWEGMVDVVNAAYDAARSRRPGVPVFPSIQIDALYGLAPGSCPPGTDAGVCYETGYAHLARVKRDRFAVSSYPYLGSVPSLDALPADWFTRAARRGGERALIAEAGWLSTPLVAQASTGQCFTALTSDEKLAAAYLDRLLSDAQAAGMDLVTWIADRDLLIAPLMTDCGCHQSAEWCAVRDLFRGPPPAGSEDTQLQGELRMKAFGAMGLRTYEGVKKPAVFRRWEESRSVPLGTP
jgi:hypothetical protein